AVRSPRRGVARPCPRTRAPLKPLADDAKAAGPGPAAVHGCGTSSLVPPQVIVTGELMPNTGVRIRAHILAADVNVVSGILGHRPRSRNSPKGDGSGDRKLH